MPYGLISLVLAMSVAQQGPELPLPSALSLRELARQADTVIVAAPVEPRQTLRFRALRVLKGRLPLGQEVQVEGCSAFFPADGEVPPARLLEVCLFLTPEPGEPARPKFRLVPTGLACLSRSGGIYRPAPAGRPGDFRLQPGGKSDDWAALLDRIQADVQQVQRLQWAHRLPTARGRNQALLDWIERHRREFQTESPSGRGLSASSQGRPGPAEEQERREQGWGELERLPFLWILESGILPDCWRAIELYAEIHSGQCLGLDQSLFNSREGRDFLVRIAADERQLAGSRRRALRFLATSRTLRGKAPLDAGEQSEILERLRPLPQAGSVGLRLQAARTILEVSRPVSASGQFNPKLVPELIKAFRAEQPGEAREALAQAVRLLGGEKEWKDLTGQPQGLGGTIQSPGARDDQVHFWLMLGGREVRVTEPPTLVLERVDPITRILVLEKKTQQLPVTVPQPAGWAGGWDGSVPLLVEFGVQGLTAGHWQMRVEGVSGPERHRWRSQPRLFKVVAETSSEGTGDPRNKPRRHAEVPGEE